VKLTAREYGAILETCRSKAAHCRTLAKKKQFEDQREELEKTAQMWEALAASLAPEQDPAVEPTQSTSSPFEKVLMGKAQTRSDKPAPDKPAADESGQRLWDEN